jgi:dTMP kinase
MVSAGMFVTFEGVDGSGKSTQAGLTAAFLAEGGREVVATREPGGTPLGERIRELLLDGPEMSAWAEASLFAAARAELAERVIRPALARGAVVVSDRYLDSSLAYQGAARGLGIDRVLDLNAGVEDLLPDRTFVLLVDEATAASRLGRRTEDRIEREGAAFREAVQEGFRAVAARFPERIVLLDGGDSRDSIAALVREQLAVRTA